MAEPWGGSLPLAVKDAIDDIFPGSEERRKIAYTLMFYNHKPTTPEIGKLAEFSGRSTRTVQHVMRILGENNLFTSELGSVPLYKHIGTVGHSRALESLSGVKGRAEAAEEAESAEDEGDEPEAPILEDGDEAPDESVEEDAAPFRRALPDAVGGAAEMRGLRESLVKMAQRQDKLEATVDQSLKEILTRLRGREEAVPLAGAVPVQSVNTLTVDPPDEEEVKQEPVQQPEADEGPFKDMTKQQVIDMAINEPDMIYALRNQGVPPTSDTIQAVPHTTSWKALELTTYTQAAYERACEDGYEGSLSDFINNAVYKYFADRGKVLQWVDVAPRQQPYYPQPAMYPRRPPS